MSKESVVAKRRRCLGVLAVEIVLALFVSVSLTCERLIEFTGTQGESFPANFMSQFRPIDGICFMALFATAIFCLELVRRIIVPHATLFFDKAQIFTGNDVKNGGGDTLFSVFFRSHWKSLFAYGTPIIVCWIAVWANYFPGTSMNDQLAIIGSPIAFANNHPILYNLALSVCVRFGASVLGDGNVGFALYVLLQMLLCCAIVSFCCIWLAFRKVSVVIQILVVAYFALTPLVGNYAMSALKDTIFGYALLLWIPFLFELTFSDRGTWHKKGTWMAFGVLILLTSLTRNNGLYISIVLLIVLFILAFRKRAWSMILAGVVALALSITPNMLLSAMGVHQLFRESVGIPLQQVSAVLCSEDGVVTDGQKSYFEKIIPLNVMRESYAPMSVDLIKYSPEFDSDYLQQTKNEFIREYFSLGLANPDIYFRAFLSQTYGYWSIFAHDTYQGCFFRISDNLRADTDIQAMEEWGLSNYSLYSNDVSESIDAVLKAVTPLFPGPGGCLLILMMCCYLLCVLKASAKPGLVFLPLFLLWGTLLLATPLACAFRYAFPFAVAMPFAIALLFMPGNRKETVELV